jgi:hypothetical protein
MFSDCCVARQYESLDVKLTGRRTVSWGLQKPSVAAVVVVVARGMSAADCEGILFLLIIESQGRRASQSERSQCYSGKTIKRSSVYFYHL